MVVDPFMLFDTAVVVEGARDCHLAFSNVFDEKIFLRSKFFWIDLPKKVVSRHLG